MTGTGVPDRRQRVVALSGPGTCTACGACVTTCPTAALLPGRHAPTVIAARCDGCWECVEICPVDALGAA